MNGISEPKVTPDKLKEQGELCSKELLDALFGKYVDADEEVRRIAEESLAANNRFRAAQTARDEAWETYNTAKKQSASNESSSPTAAPNAVNGGQTKKETKCKNP
jgi:hypothetical protein